DFPETTGTQVVVDVSVLHQDPLVPRVGQAAQVVAEHLAKAAPRAWGPHETTLRAWDREQMVAFAHRRKPRVCVLYLSGPQGRGHAFSGQIRRSWRGSQVLEQVSVVVGFQDEDAITPEVFPVLVEALASAGLVEALRVRRIPGRVDVTYVPVWAGPAIPVGLAIGPERLRRIGVGPARSGPIAGTLVGGGEHRAVWYPALRAAASPLRALDLVPRPTAHMAAVARGSRTGVARFPGRGGSSFARPRVHPPHTKSGGYHPCCSTCAFGPQTLKTRPLAPLKRLFM